MRNLNSASTLSWKTKSNCWCVNKIWVKPGHIVDFRISIKLIIIPLGDIFNLLGPLFYSLAKSVGLWAKINESWWRQVSYKFFSKSEEGLEKEVCAPQSHNFIPILNTAMGRVCSYASTVSAVKLLDYVWAGPNLKTKWVFYTNR